MILIKDGRVIDPKTQKDEILDIIIKDDKIYKIGKYHITDDYESVIDAKGKIVAPGLIDVHVHLEIRDLLIKRIYKLAQERLPEAAIQQ